ncbi:MAG: 1-acyl-sn-glycerol-3-phosphate acyltransferase [Bacilli bacterium]
MARRGKIVYYDDLLNDEFSGTHIKRKPLGNHFKYIHRNWLWKFFSYFFYYCLALPILWLVSKLGWGVKVVGRKQLKKLRLHGYFIYCNHTQIGDGFFPQCFVSGLRRNYIISNDDSVSLFGLRNFVMMLGNLPLPDSPEHTQIFIDAIEYHYKRGCAITIFPEAHIWPYSTRIRPFGPQSFVYPASLLAPVIATCVTYEERKLFRFLPPRVVMHISSPIYPNPDLALPERSAELQKAVYRYMVDTASSLENVEYVEYRPRNKKNS